MVSIGKSGAFRGPLASSQPSTSSVIGRPRIEPYKQALTALAERTRAPLPSLALSFALLHELTAVVPFVAFFYAARTLRAGERVILSYPEKFTGDPSNIEFKYPEQGFWGRVRREWWIEGRLWADRMGRRYGLFGLSRHADGELDSRSREISSVQSAAPDIANAVFAYFLTKAILPVRLGLSMYWSPAFSRSVIERARTSLVQALRHKPR
ncbi:uncharacterized protein C8Q71DRAFT_909554 [Rhodofomes roseus]|uniref:Uncharacterized protein n=1 Tax=Rhodofomes roseus TaxID=34475 RepID=A0ABQ8K9Q5_9APHY|nr:uncharacterized protein C8Q71DRAFT_909554 [Rhodofomes roseus]KAH9833517.1 hypothetical protein C8Q71DRAFT_909554 [Rhodofomes roseus]